MKRPLIWLLLLGAAVSGMVAYSLFRNDSRNARHSVDLTWQAPRPRPGVTVVAYNVYRSTTSKGPYVRIATQVKDLKYTDWLVNSATTYYYVVTSLDSAGRESPYSAEIRAAVP